MNQDSINKLIKEAFAIEAEEAKSAGALGYMARAFTLATMPHKKQEGNEFIRKNGDFKLTMLAPSDVGLPYGALPRLIVAWISTEAVRTQQKVLVLGHSMAEFMEELGLRDSSGGDTGSIKRFKNQMVRLFSCAISCTYNTGEHWAIKHVNPVSQADLWWQPKQPDQVTHFESTLTLGDEFFKEVIKHKVPVDLRVLRELKRSPLAIDIYCWSTYRVSYLEFPTTIPWFMLHNQFGSNYANNAQGMRNFKKEFLKELAKVNVFYTALNFEETNKGLLLRPSKPHIRRVTVGKQLPK